MTADTPTLSFFWRAFKTGLWIGAASVVVSAVLNLLGVTG